MDNLIKLGSQCIETLNSCKFLGVHIDSKLSFKTHIDLVINKISRNTGIFYKIRDNLPMKARINYYYSFFYPYLIYNVLTFGSTYECHLAKLITQQKRIIRAIANSDFHDHTDPLFYGLKLLKFTDIYKYYVSLYMYKNKHLFSVQHNINTPNNNMAVPSFNRLSLCKHPVRYMGPKIWNELPNYLKEKKSTSLIKKALSSYFINQYSEE